MRLSDSTVAAIAAGSAAVMIAQQVGGKATRDALFLSAFSVSALPLVMIASAVLAIAAVALMSWGIARRGPDRFVPVAFFVNGLAFLVEWLWATPRSQGVAIAVYLHVASAGAVVISGYWSVINERFNPHTAKRHVGKIGAGAALGGVLGGVVADRIAANFDAHAMLLVLALMNGACAVGIARVGRRHRPRLRERLEIESKSTLVTLQRTPYLRHMATVVALTALAGALLDFGLKFEAADAFADNQQDLMSFFALFYTITSLGAFLVQATLSRVSLRRAGLAGTLAALPISIFAFGTAAVISPRLLFAALVRGMDAVISNSLYRASYELLYTPLPTRTKRPTKAIIDVGFMRLGDAAGSVLLLVLLGLTVDPRWITAVAVIVSIATLWIMVRLHRGYIAALESSVRSGSVRLPEHELLDATTRRTAESSSVTRLNDPPVNCEIDRESLELALRAIASHDANLRGTAIEYLDNVLPESARKSLQPLIGESLSPARARQSREEVADDVIRSFGSLV